MRSVVGDSKLPLLLQVTYGNSAIYRVIICSDVLGIFAVHALLDVIILSVIELAFLHFQAVAVGVEYALVVEVVGMPVSDDFKSLQNRSW